MSERAAVRGELVKLTGALTTLEFRGELLSDVTTDNGRSPRWTDMKLYRITEGANAGKYVLGIIGCTVVYHRHGSDCNTGVPTAFGELPEEAEPCERCTPPGDADRSLMVDLEEEWRNVQVCDDSAAVVEVLRATNRGKRAQGRAGSLSRPAEQLLQRAMRKDSSFDPSKFVERL